MRSRRSPVAVRLRIPVLLGTALAGTAVTLCLPLRAQTTPKAEPAPAAEPVGGAVPAQATKPRPHPRPTKPPTNAATPANHATPVAPSAAPAGAAPATLAQAAGAGAGTSNAAFNVSARLSQNGAGTCAGVIDAEAAPTMVGVTESDTVSQWSTVDPRDKHAASVFIGQRYGGNPAVPFGITGLIASPTPTGSCDVTSVQVVSSPLPCLRVRETLVRTGKVLGEIAGMPVIGADGGQTMLMPTATNTCVLVAFRAKYGN